MSLILTCFKEFTSRLDQPSHSDLGCVILVSPLFFEECINMSVLPSEKYASKTNTLWKIVLFSFCLSCKTASKVYFSIFFRGDKLPLSINAGGKSTGFIFIPSEMPVPSATFRKPPLCCWRVSQLRTVSDFKSHHSHAPSLSLGNMVLDRPQQETKITQIKPRWI